MAHAFSANPDSIAPVIILVHHAPAAMVHLRQVRTQPAIVISHVQKHVHSSHVHQMRPVHMVLLQQPVPSTMVVRVVHPHRHVQSP